VFVDHRQRTSSPAFTSETGILICIVLFTTAYCGDTNLATGGVLIKPSDHFRRSMYVKMDHDRLEVGGSCKLAQLPPV
ncbi:unnamed protein product, partial [Rotaria socialis]